MYKTCRSNNDKETKRSVCHEYYIELTYSCSKLMLENLLLRVLRAINFLLHGKFATINQRSAESGSVVHSKENGTIRTI